MRVDDGDAAKSRAELLAELRALRLRLAQLRQGHGRQERPAPPSHVEDPAVWLPAYTFAEQRLATQYAVTRILSEIPSLAEAAPRVLQTVCENMGWELGILWRVDRQHQLLRCMEIWHSSELELASFVATCRAYTFQRGAGLPGRIWASGEAHWISDVQDDANFPRIAIAAAEGLHAAFGVPIRLGGEILGVLEFFSRQVRSTYADLLEMMFLIGGQIGQFMERTAAEEALRESQTRFALFMRYLPGLAFIKDAQGRHLYVNEKHEALFHWQAGSWRDKIDQELFPAEIAAQFAENDRRVLEQQTILQTIEVVPQDDGLHHYLVTKFPILNDAGQAVLLGGIGIDITDRIRAEEQLQESEERFRQLAENIRGVFWMFDPRRAQMIYVSPAYVQIWGRSVDDLRQQPHLYFQAVHPDDRERMQVALRAQERGENTDEEYRIVRPDGSVRWIWDRAFAVKDRHGRVYRIAGIADDITERRRTEEAQRFLAQASAALSSSLEYEQTLASLARLAVPLLADWSVVDLLDEQRGIHRLIIAHADPEREALARELQQRYPPRPDANVGVGRVLRTGEPELVPDITEAYLELIARDAEHLRLLRLLGLTSYMCVPLQARGRTIGAISLVSAESRRRYGPEDLMLARDLAARAAEAVDNARLYDEVQQALLARDQFLSIVSHELKTPISALLSYAQLLQRRLQWDDNLERNQRALHMLVEQSRRLDRLISSLLDIARMQTGHLTIEHAVVDLCELARRVIEATQPTLERHLLELSVPQEPIRIIGDELRLEQVLQNLLQNAIKYSPGGGRILLTVGRHARMALVAVRDEGIGIPAAALAYLFSRFYRASNVDQQQIAGMGLGLYVVREIVALHGGSVQVESSEGQGSTFTVLLPLSSQVEEGVAGVARRPEPTAEDSGAI